jgi:hypothetical protein
LAREAAERAGGKNPYYLTFFAQCQAMGGELRAAQATMNRVLALCE